LNIDIGIKMRIGNRMSDRHLCGLMQNDLKLFICNDIRGRIRPDVTFMENRLIMKVIQFAGG
jgi:hypothetical protein